MKRRYSELKNFETMEERFEYLKLHGEVGLDTFGADRYLNQIFYHTKEWRDIRKQIIARDNGCDLGLDEIPEGIFPIVHHMNAITVDDILSRNPDILDPEYLITVSPNTHKAIHYSMDELNAGRPPTVIERKPGDTTLW